MLANDRNRWFTWSPVMLAFGIGIYFGLQWQPSPNWLLLPVFLSVVMGVALKLRRSGFFYGVLILFLISIGFSAAVIRHEVVKAPVLEKKTVTEVTGVVLEMGSSSKKQRLILADLEFGAKNVPSLDKIRLTVRTGTSHIKPGQIITLKAVLLPPPPPAYPGAYDFQRDLYFKSIGAVGYAISKPHVTGEKNTLIDGLNSLISRNRHQVNQIVSENAPNETTGFSIAIMTGERSSLQKKAVTDMRQSGLAHLLAISGLHMGMVGGILFFGTRYVASLFPTVALHYSVKKWAAVLAMIGITGYLLLSGLPVSALRAYLMIGMIFIAVCFDRSALSLRNLAFAALLLLLFMPESLHGASFQMSFSAVFCLIAAYERYGLRFTTAANSGGSLRRCIYYIGGVGFTSIIASLATAPFAIYHFGSVAALGIVANLIAVPVMGFWVMPWTLLSLISMPAGLSELPLQMAGYGIMVILKTAAFVAKLPSSSLQIGSYSAGLLVMISLAVLWTGIWRTQLRWGAVIFLLVGLVFQAFNEKPDILFADSGNLFLAKTQDGRFKISSLRSDRFERNRWESMYGIQKFDKIDQKKINDAFIRCDPLGCVWTQNQNLVTYSKNWMSQKDDCFRADIILSSSPVGRNCSASSTKLIIDKFDLWRKGTHAIYFNENGDLKVESVNSVRGRRPWVSARYHQSID